MKQLPVDPRARVFLVVPASKPDTALGQRINRFRVASKRSNSARAMARRMRQMDMGQLKAENGLRA